MKYKLKYTIKVFKKNKVNSNLINGKLDNNNEFIRIYLLKNNLLKKLCYVNFANVIYNKKIYSTKIKITYKKTGNEIETIEFYQIKKNVSLKYECVFKRIINKYLILKKNCKLPRKIRLNVIYHKKNIKDIDFNFENFKFKKLILFSTKI